MKYFIYIITFLFSISLVTALNCTYDNQPYLAYGETIDWNCVSSIDEGRCYGIVYYQNDLLHIYPNIEQVQGEGIIDYFKLDNGLVSIKFGKDDLYEGYNYTLMVICSDQNNIDEFGTDIIPFRQDLTEVAYRGVWLKENMSAIFMFGIVILIVGILLWALLKR